MATSWPSELGVSLVNHQLVAALRSIGNLAESSPQLLRQAYCINPACDDECPFGYCAQPDITGLLVRISAYITNFCLGKHTTVATFNNTV